MNQELKTITPNQNTFKKNAFSKSMIGACSGLFIGVVLQPLEIVKTTLMINPMKNMELEKLNFYKAISVTIKDIYRQEGIKGFWRGTKAASTKLVISSSIYFSSMQEIEKQFDKYNICSGSVNHFWSSAIARSLSGVLTNPIQVLRTRFEVINFNEYTGLYDGIKKMYKQEGFKGFSTGALATIGRDGPFAGIYYVIYKQQKRFYEKNFPGMGFYIISLQSGLIAGMVASIFTNPFDVIRARLQYNHFYKSDNINRKYTGIYDGCQKIYKHEGWMGFMKGLAPRLMKKPMTNSCGFLIYEILHKYMHKDEAF